MNERVIDELQRHADILLFYEIAPPDRVGGGRGARRRAVRAIPFRVVSS